MMQQKNSFLIILLPVLLLLLFSACGGMLAPHDPYQQQLALSLQPPDSEYLCGTDRYGRCVFSRILAGASLSVFTALLLTAAAALLGTAAGMYGGYYRGSLFDRLLLHFIDIMLAFPGMMLALVIAGITGGGLFNAAVALLCSAWAPYARLARRQTITVSSYPYVEAARLSCCSDTEIIFRYLFPSALKPILLMAAANAATMLLALSALSFLGLGAQPPAAEWGAMISGSRSLLQTAPWTIFAPGAALFITVTVFNLTASALHDLLEPKQTTLLQEQEYE